MQDAYHQLYAYAMTRGRDPFVLQYVTDAFAAQTATPATKPIKLAFALIGLYLHVERGFSGVEVQRVHMQLARRKRDWPTFPLPSNRGDINAEDVLAVAAGEARDAAISQWCRSVWKTFADTRDTVASLLRDHRVL